MDELGIRMGLVVGLDLGGRQAVHGLRDPMPDQADVVGAIDELVQGCLEDGVVLHEAHNGIVIEQDQAGGFA